MRALLITLVVLLLLVVGADIGGRAIAESKAGEAIATRSGNQVAPDVDIHGFSFLAQALPGDYGQITLSTTDLVLGPLAPVAATVELYDVTYPLSDAFAGSTDGLAAERATLTATVPVSALGDALQVPDLQLGSTANGDLRLSGSVSVAGNEVPVTADLGVSITDGALALSASGVSAAGVDVPLPASLADDLSLTVPLDALPIDITSGTVGVDGANLTLQASTGRITADSLR
ncbi:LmeA family phospholipid-binding protein [Nakamurella alba]|uniref:LmeA family phospholipid-binding protein n=1 Tax=Nakamurella alba TaxID=2665158 RepID=UPI0012B8D651|nr:DUF2993 domain-containing protein [Nakamurella alba]